MDRFVGVMVLMLLFQVTRVDAQHTIENYVFFNLDRYRIHEESFLSCKNCIGAQLKYTWRELEPEKGRYCFEKIKQDLDFLTQQDKKLFIQLQDVTFDTSRVNVPQYLLKKPVYNGGVAIQYITTNKDSIIRQDGFVARRWDPAVESRFHKLLAELGDAFDGKIAGINLPETAVGFGETGKLYPEGFTPQMYRDAILARMKALKKAFPTSVVIQYANFMPGEWLPRDDNGYQASLYKAAAENNIGMGGPDLKIYNKYQMNHSYKFLKKYAMILPTGVAVQWGNYEEINPKTGKQVTIEEIYSFARNEIRLNYVFWSTQEPFYSNRVIPFLNATLPE